MSRLLPILPRDENRGNCTPIYSSRAYTTSGNTTKKTHLASCLHYSNYVLLYVELLPHVAPYILQYMGTPFPPCLLTAVDVMYRFAPTEAAASDSNESVCLYEPFPYSKQLVFLPSAAGALYTIFPLRQQCCILSHISEL